MSSTTEHEHEQVVSRARARIVRRLAALALACALIAGQAANAGSIAARIRGQAIAASSPPLVDPPVRPVSSAPHMLDADLVLGITVGGSGRAYPWWVVKNFHVVNDEVGGAAVALAFCEQCTGAAAFRRTIGGRVLSFEVAGVYNGTIILRDRQTRTLWAPFSGRALEGPLAGRRLERVPVSLTRWDAWSARHPGGEVAWGPQVLRRGHGAWYEPGKWGIVSEMGATLQAWDPRLPENVLVYGMEGSGGARSYPLSRVLAAGGVVNDAIGGLAAVVVARGPLDVAAFDRTVRGRPLTFRASAGLHAVMNDEETGSDWSADGEALAGPLRGERLAPLDGYVVEWHVWSAYHPGADVFGGAAAPEAAEGARPVFPALTLPVPRGAPRAVSLTGRLNLIVLWAAWCPSCGDVMPLVQRLVEERAAEGVAAVGIAIHLPDDENEKEVVRRFVARAGVTFPTFLVDEAGYERLEALARSAGAPGVLLPTVFLADAGGRVVSVLTGPQAGRELARTLAAHLPRAQGAR